MTDGVEPLFVRHVGGTISSSPLLVDADNDGSPEVFVGGPALFGLRWDGEPIPRWPKWGRGPFASSPAFGDIDGDGRGEIIAGCDDHRVYAFRLDGTPAPGWPVLTGRDVFSTPAVVDLDRDKALEVVVGSDDGVVYALRGDGKVAWTAALPDRPFVSASPTLVRTTDERGPSIVVGAWDRKLHGFTRVGTERPSPWPVAGNLVWSSATSFEATGGIRFLTWAADSVYLSSVDGEPAPGWPVRTKSWMVSSPAVVALHGSEATIIVGAERLYAWDLAGRIRPGWPVDTGDFVWSSPIAFDVDGDGIREVFVGSWDGAIYGFRPDGSPVAGFPLRTEGPIFATPAAAPLADGGGLLVAASWDGTIRGWLVPNARFRPGDWTQWRGSAARTGAQPMPVNRVDGVSGGPSTPSTRPEVRGACMERWARFRSVDRVVIEGEGLHDAKALRVAYEIVGERRRHTVPVVNSRGQFAALVQPLQVPHWMRYWVELERWDGTEHRWPRAGAVNSLTRPAWLSGRRRYGGYPPAARSATRR